MSRIYPFYGSVQFGIESLGLFEVLAEILQVAKTGKLLHLDTVRLQFLLKELAEQLQSSNADRKKKCRGEKCVGKFT